MRFAVPSLDTAPQDLSQHCFANAELARGLADRAAAPNKVSADISRGLEDTAGSVR